MTIIIIMYFSNKEEYVNLCKKDKFHSIYNVLEERNKRGLPIINFELYTSKFNEKNSSNSFDLKNENNYLPMKVNYYCFSSSEELKFKSKDNSILTVQYYFKNKNVRFVLEKTDGKLRFLNTKEAFIFFRENKYLKLFKSNIFYNDSLLMKPAPASIY